MSGTHIHLNNDLCLGPAEKLETLLETAEIESLPIEKVHAELDRLGLTSDRIIRNIRESIKKTEHYSNNDLDKQLTCATSECKKAETSPNAELFYSPLG
jgi:hypothetical protein